MTIAEITPAAVRGIEPPELLSIHRRLHQLFARTMDDAEMNAIRTAHKTLVAEMTRRGMRHTSALRKSTDAPVHDQEFVGMTGEQVAVIGALAERIPQGECADLGGGDGMLARMLQNSGRDVTVVEKDAEAVVRCGMIDLRAEYSDVLSYLSKQGDDSVDCAYSLNLLEHVEYPVAVLAASVRVSREVSVHAVQLGKTWKTIEDLRYALRSVKYSKAIRPLPGNCAMVEVCKHLPDCGDDSGDIVLRSDYVSLQSRKNDNEIEFVVREDCEEDRKSEIETLVNLAKDVGGFVHCSFVADGPRADAVPIFDLVLRRSRGLRARIIKSVTPTGWFAPPKSRSRFLLTDMSDKSVKSIIADWPGTMLKRDGVLHVECLPLGTRGIVQWDGKHARVRLDGSRQNIASKYPDLVADLRTIEKSVVLDCVVTDNGVHACDLMYHDGKDWSRKPFVERRKKLLEVTVGSDLRTLHPALGKTVRTRRELTSAIKSFARQPASSGAMLRRCGDAYPTTPTTRTWATIINAVTARIIVTVVKGISPGPWTHSLACRIASDGMLDLGDAEPSMLKRPKGSIVDCTVEEFTPSIADGTLGAYALDARVIRIDSRAKTNAHTAEDIIKRADRANVLRTTQETRAILRKAKLVKTTPITKEETGANGNLDFKSGDSGTGVLQEHGVGLTKEEVDASARGMNRGTWAVYTDFRMRRKGDDYYEGGEFFTPGNNKKPNRILKYADGNRVRMSFKVSPKGGPRVVKGLIKWLSVGARSPVKFAPGTEGALANTWGIIRRVGTFHWAAGTQDEHYKEFKFSFAGDLAKLNGRWIFTFASSRTGGRTWTAMRPKEQRMDSERK